MLKLYKDADANLKFLRDKSICVIGYGNQGRAQALNLRDSGLRVSTLLRKTSKNAKMARKDGIAIAGENNAAGDHDIFVFLLPDEKQGEAYERNLKDRLKKNAVLLFASGFSIHYRLIRPPRDADVILVAPKGPGALVRSAFTGGSGVHNLIAVEQNASGKAKEIALAYSKAIGGTRIGALETTFREEIETDLFGEQAVLCGGATELVRAGFDTLLRAGYPEELAYFECLHELKQCVDLLYEGGLSRMWQAISPTAQYGAMTRGRRVIGKKARAEMQKLLKEIQSGRFTEEWMKEAKSGAKSLKTLKTRDGKVDIERVGSRLRKQVGK